VVDESAAGGNAGVWEEYRYDPLGRRVLVRSVRQGNTAAPGAPYSILLCGTSNCRSSITRYMWAGDQVLWELRAPGADGDNLEATTGASEPRFYGRVSYLHAGGVDRPLSIWKDGVGSVRPHQNWRGQFARGTWGAGSLQGRSSDCASVGAPDCIPLQWPGYRTNAWHQKSAGDPDFWMGSLVDGMRDPTGQIYMRNHYYDPATGQFTQPDPIGIAGGLNAYGFAAGDPVSYADSYGLSASCPDRVKRDEKCDEDQQGDGIVKRHDRCEVAGILTSYITNLRSRPREFGSDAFPAEFDFKFGDTGDDLYQVGDQWLRADEFGNYAPGYAGTRIAGRIGQLLVIGRGILYAMEKGSGEHWSDSASRPMINAGAARARLENEKHGRVIGMRGGVWGRAEFVQPLTSTAGCPR
jgi:RHS repeat-associated protein